MPLFNRLLLAGLATASVLVGSQICGPFSAHAQGAPKGDAANGQKVYLATGCFECHGRAGQGGAYNQFAPTLAKTQLPYEGFKQQLRDPVSDMPAYSEVVMSEQQVADIFAFLQSLSGRQDVKNFPLLNN